MIDPKFNIPQNQLIQGYIESAQPSAHSDVVEELTRSAEDISGAIYYCPDPHNYSYALLHTEANVIFAFAFGMRGLAFRLPVNVSSDAVAQGAEALTELGSGWMVYNPFNDNEQTATTRSKLKRWCKQAYEFAIQS